MKYLTTPWIWMITFSVMIVHDLLYLLLRWFSKTPYLLCCRLWHILLKIIFPLTGVRVTIKGRDHIPQTGAYIIASTHQSMLDIPLMLLSVPPGFAFYAKRGLTKIPVIGWNLKGMDSFLIDRKNPRQALKDLAKSKKKVIEGRPLLIFPEGTRSSDGRVALFKRGAFSIAVQTGTPVIPCVISGAYDVVRKGQFWVKPGKVTITFGQAISVEKVPKDKEKEASVDVMTATKNTINRLLK
jgi:1-acyl-sn-glycerol-3-phosphate acyltransferase